MEITLNKITFILFIQHSFMFTKKIPVSYAHPWYLTLFCLMTITMMSMMSIECLLAQCDCTSVSMIDNIPFSFEEMDDIICRQNDKKSPGGDGLSANIIKALHAVSPDILYRLYNGCLQN